MLTAPNFYNVSDQNIYNEGTYFKPQERFTLPYNQVSIDDESLVEPEGILSASVVNNSGNDFSVYNPDPNTISNQNYRPNYDYRRFSEYGSNPSIDNIKQMDMNQNYFYKPPPSKLQGLMSMIPGAGIARFLGNQIGGMLPTNRRGIFENELAGQGVMVNNIGQIVQGDGAYDDVSGRNVMAGYNPEKMTAKTFDDRIEMAKNKMSDINIDPNTDKTYKEARIAALEAGKANFLKTQKKANKIYDFEEEEKNKKKKKGIINRYITKKKETKAAKDAKAAQGIVDVEAVKAAIKKAEAATTNSGGFTYDTNTTGQASSNQYGTYTPSNTPQQAQDNQDRGRGEQTSNAPTRSAPSRSSSYSSSRGSNFGGRFHNADGGRIGYFFGGLAARRMKR